jgi:L-asparaginase
VIKTNANTIDTSKAYKMRPLGEMVSDKPFFFYPPQTRTPTGKIPVDVSNITLEAVSEEWISMDIILV